MKTIGIVRPASLVEGGNHVTAARWTGILERLGHGVFVEESWSGRAADALVALHAGKSHDSVVRFHRAHPDRPIVVAATGTDIYVDASPSSEARESFLLASRVVVLQPNAIAALPAEVRERARVIHQSVVVAGARPPQTPDAFQICSVAHLRPVKDPLLPAAAARLLPDRSRIRFVLVGGLLHEPMRGELERALDRNPRFHWLGVRSREDTLDILARSHVFVSSSRTEGGSNVCSEALALGLPILATRIPGNVGILGEDHPGLFPAGDATALAERMLHAESDASFRRELELRSRDRAWITDPELEIESWRALLEEILP